jgi:hypothetical protein
MTMFPWSIGWKPPGVSQVDTDTGVIEFSANSSPVPPGMPESAAEAMTNCPTRLAGPCVTLVIVPWKAANAVVLVGVAGKITTWSSLA